MKIKYFSYYNKALDWELETTFFANLTLLVGISGVGKTQILDAIWRLKDIANGKPSNGVEWKILFETSGDTEYCWSGEYESNPILEERSSVWADEDEDSKLKILSEDLSMNGQSIINRNASEIILRGEKTPKLSPFESVLSILNQEEDIAPAYQGFKRIIRSNFSDYRQHVFSREVIEFNKTLNSQPTLEQIQESSLDSRLKIALVYYSVPEVFNAIKERFIDIFPQVEDMRFEIPKDQDFPPIFDEHPLLQIKEKGVKPWIQQRNISSGMYKTFMHISEMFLWPKGTVILIDEFENSLGVNCLDVLTKDLIQEGSGLQFIVTSHHPYIINNISPRYWKVVTRNGGVVATHDTSDLKLSNSSHQAFIQLINLDKYREGIAIP